MKRPGGKSKNNMLSPFFYADRVDPQNDMPMQLRFLVGLFPALVYALLPLIAIAGIALILRFIWITITMFF